MEMKDRSSTAVRSPVRSVRGGVVDGLDVINVGGLKCRTRSEIVRPPSPIVGSHRTVPTIQRSVNRTITLPPMVGKQVHDTLAHAKPRGGCRVSVLPTRVCRSFPRYICSGLNYFSCRIVSWKLLTTKQETSYFHRQSTPPPHKTDNIVRRMHTYPTVLIYPALVDTAGSRHAGEHEESGMIVLLPSPRHTVVVLEEHPASGFQNVPGLWPIGN